MSSPGAAPRAAASLSNARAEASRRNGAKSRGPQTPEGKARSAQNALKHGFRAQRYVVLPDEDAAAFASLEAALMEELAPDGALQTLLARRVVAATWRLERAERLEAELFAEEKLPGKSLALALIRDCNGARAFDTLLRYRGGTLAEFWRALRTLKALQAEARAYAAAGDEAPAPAPDPRAAPALAAMVRDPAPALTARPDEPESRGNPGCSDRAHPSEPGPAPAWLPPQPLPAPGGHDHSHAPEGRDAAAPHAPQAADAVGVTGADAAHGATVALAGRWR